MPDLNGPTSGTTTQTRVSQNGPVHDKSRPTSWKQENKKRAQKGGQKGDKRMQKRVQKRAKGALGRLRERRAAGGASLPGLAKRRRGEESR